MNQFEASLDIHDVVYLLVPKYGCDSNILTVTHGVVEMVYKKCAAYSTEKEEWKYKIKLFPKPSPYSEFYCENTIINKTKSDIGNSLFLTIEDAKNAMEGIVK